MKVQLPVVLTATRAELGSRCHRRHVLSDGLEYGLYKSPAAAFGNIIHAGAATWWKWTSGYTDAMNAAHAYSAMMETVKQEWERQAITSDKYSLAMAERMMEAYTQQATLAGVFTGVADWKVLQIEDRVRVPLGDHIFSFQNDRALADFDSGRILLVDTKTTSRPDAKWRAQWSRSLQMKLYRKAVQIQYPDRDIDILVEGIDKNVKPKLHYVVTPHWSDGLLDEAVRQFEEIASKDAELYRRHLLADGSFDIAGLEEDALVNTSHNYEDCYSYGMACPFTKLCDAEPEDRAGILHAEYKHIEQDY